MFNPTLRELCWKAVLGASIAVAPLMADTVELSDGSILNGTIISMNGDSIILDTSYAGELTIDRSEVATFSTDGEIFVQLDDGSEVRGRVSGDEEGDLTIASRTGELSTEVGDVTASWQPGALSPSEAAMEAERRKWSFRAGLDITGKSGNSDESGIGMNLSAVLEGPDDRLELYGNYDREESNDVKTVDETRAGIDFTSYVSPRWGWYARTEAEVDEFEDIDLRLTAAGGASYRFINSDTQDLEGRVGLSYLYESYGTADDVENPGIELAIIHRWDFADNWQVRNSLQYIPSIEDFGDYRIDHESYVEAALGSSDSWAMQVGLENQYNSEPTGELDELDTTYFIRLVYLWSQD